MRNDALSVVSKLAASPNNVFTRTQAAELGVSRYHLRVAIERGLICEPYRGVFVGHLGPNGVEWRQRVAAATSTSPGRVVASHRSAGRLHWLEGFESETAVEVSAQAPRLVRLPGVIGHRVLSLGRDDVVAVDGVRCTNLARTLCDLGSIVEEARLERAFDGAMRSGISERWLRSVAERLVRPNAAGPSAVLALLDRHQRRGVVRGSWFEKLVEQCLDHPELSGLVIQHELRDGTGEHVATFDLAIPDAKLGIEAHSRRHHFGAEAESSDEHRDHAASLLGWDVMYLGYSSIQSPASVSEQVRARVTSRRAIIS